MSNELIRTDAAVKKSAPKLKFLSISALLGDGAKPLRQAGCWARRSAEWGEELQRLQFIERRLMDLFEGGQTSITADAYAKLHGEAAQAVQRAELRRLTAELDSQRGFLEGMEAGRKRAEQILKNTK